jgi:hypothetical protein
MFVCCDCFVLSGRDLCDELITRPEESYRLWCVIVRELENLKNEEVMTRVGSQRHRKKKIDNGLLWPKHVVSCKILVIKVSRIKALYTAHLVKKKIKHLRNHHINIRYMRRSLLIHHPVYT